MILAVLLLTLAGLAAGVLSIMTSGNSYDGLVVPFLLFPLGLVLQAVILLLLRFHRKR